MARRPAVGFHMGQVSSISDVLAECRQAGFNFLCTDLCNPDYRRRALAGETKDPTEPFSFFDMSLPIKDWHNSVVSCLSDVQDSLESSNATLRDNACKLLSTEFGYAMHLSTPSAIVNLHPGESVNLAKLVHSKLGSESNHSAVTLWIRFPMTIPKDDATSNGDWSDDDDTGMISSWNMWNQFRLMGGVERRTFPALLISLDLPDDGEIDRWLGESVKAIFLTEEVFLTNKRGYPILPVKTQTVVKKFMDKGAQIIMIGKEDKNPLYYTHYGQYFEFLYNSLMKDWEEDPVRKYTKGYEDYLQSPLQPLMDNLEANTYEVFEQDPIKYNLYQEAIEKALLSKVPEMEKDTTTLVVMVVGAGRGPIVRNCLQAAESVNRKIKLFAVEKNVNAVCTLLHLKERFWGDKVTVISCDMRDFKPEEKADIMVSELLGSFSDNELSPECLDGAQCFLKDDGIMIPQSYTSFVAPVMCPKLHTDIRTFYDVNKHQLHHYETPYVVLMKTYYRIDKPQPMFTFSHPKKDLKATNDRYGSAEFTAQLDCLMHGISGFFECHLFGGVQMSILPETHSEKMFSWFPILFPLREPIQIKKGDKIKIHFWRCSNKHNVWYEWNISSPFPTAIHNPNGRSYTIGL